MKLKKINLDEYNFRESRTIDLSIQIEHNLNNKIVGTITSKLLRDIVDNIHTPIKFDPYLNENR